MTTEEYLKKLEELGPNELTPPANKSELLKFLACICGGFSLLLWAGGILCFIAYIIQVINEGDDATQDNVSALTLEALHQVGKQE